MIKTFESSNILKLKDCDTKNMDHDDDDTRERVFASVCCICLFDGWFAYAAFVFVCLLVCCLCLFVCFCLFVGLLPLFDNDDALATAWAVC